MRQPRSFGAWQSGISPEILSGEVVSLSTPRVDTTRNHIYYLEADCNGHGRIMRTGVHPQRKILPEKYNVGSSVNGYGGGAFIVDCDGHIVFVDGVTNAVNRASTEAHDVETLIHSTNAKFADLCPHPSSASFVLALREEKSHGKMHPDTSIVLIDTVSKTCRVVQSGADFYSHARFSPDGQHVCWLEWNFPHMQWTGAILKVAEFRNSDFVNARQVVSDIGVGQPRWGTSGTLYFASERSGYQQLYAVSLESNTSRWLRFKELEQCEFAGAEFWLSSLTYFELSEKKIVATYTRDATSFVAVLDLVTGKHIDLDLEINDIAYDAMQRINDYEFLVIGASASCPPVLYRISLDPGTLHLKNTTVLARSLDMYRIPQGSLSTPKPFRFPRSSPDADANPALKHGHAFLMLPTSPWYCAIPGKLPPCIVFAHGGPTKHHRPSVNLESQFMTSRGFAVVLLNHVGSTGYGGAYRDAMNGTWGVSDVQDAVDCVNALVRHGVVDRARIGITGGSAGGYLTLQAMCTAPETWAAGISICGISDMRAFARDTHKFESCYDQVLIRNIIASQRQEAVDVDALYAARSPVTHAARLRAPLLLLQGTVDPVVLPNQATMFKEAAKCHLRKGKMNGFIADEGVKVVIYENEGHGFHLASSKKHSLEEQEAWWLRSLCWEKHLLA